MSAGRRRSRTKEISIVLSEPLSHRELDRQALEWLSTQAAAGSPIGPCWPFTGESWDVIFQRFSNNRYDDTPQRLLWRSRHYHVRRLYCDDSPWESVAAYVSRIWEGSPEHAETVRTAASRATAAQNARDWITGVKASSQQPFSYAVSPEPPSDALIYEALDLALTQLAARFSSKQKRKPL